MASSYNPKITTDGLLLCLDAFNKKSYPGTGTTWTDLSGKSNNGTINNASYSSGSFVFSGAAGQYIAITSANINIVNDYSVSLWVKRNGGTGVYLYIGYGGNTGMYFESYGATDTVTWFFGANSPQNSSWGNILSSSNFTNIVLTVNTNTKTIIRYVNGIVLGTPQVITNSIVAPLSTNTYQINSGTQTWAGSVSNLQIYNRILSATEIQQNFNALRGRFGI